MSSKILKVVLLLFFSILYQTVTKAQMFVSPNSYVYVNNDLVYINQDLELNAASSTFYLRGGAQLLQASINPGINKGLGSLSVYQEGDTDDYEYNYWCSPVGGNSSATTGNSPFSITQLKDVKDYLNSNDPIILPRNNYQGKAWPSLSIAPYWIWKFTAKNNYAGWTQVASAPNLNAGEGFTMKGTDGTNNTTVDGKQNNPGDAQRYDFRGKPNEGTITIPVADQQFTLTGNPYPSAIDLQAFLLGQASCTGLAYFWEQDKVVDTHNIGEYKGGYGVYSPAGDVNVNGVYSPAVFYSYDGSGNQSGTPSTSPNHFERRFSPIGQGFMIVGKGSGVVEMKNEYRVFVKEGKNTFSEFAKNLGTNTNNGGNNNPKSGFLPAIQSVSGFDYTTVSKAGVPQIRFNTLMNNKGVSQVVLAFSPEATDGIDRAMDAPSTNESSQTDVYFVIDDKSFVIDVVDFNLDKKIPIGFRNKGIANFKITVNEVVNFYGARNIYLHDKLADVYYDIKNDFCELNLPAGTNNTQYEITFKNGIPIINNSKENNVVILQNNTTKTATINNPLQKELASCTFYDVVGKLIFSKKDLGSNLSYEVPTSNLTDGIYIVKLITKDKVETGIKILIKN